MSVVIKEVTIIHNLDHISDLSSAVSLAQVEGQNTDLRLVAQVLSAPV